MSHESVERCRKVEGWSVHGVGTAVEAVEGVEAVVWNAANALL